MDNNEQNDIMTLSEIASYLKVSEKTILRLVQTGELPGAKVSNQWRFIRDIIDNWLTERMQNAANKDLISVISTGENLIPLSRIVTRNRIILDLEPGSKQDIITQLVAPLADSTILKNDEDFIADILRREEVVSTALAHNVAIPHAQDSSSIATDTPVMVLGICREGTDFDSLDGEPTKLFFLPCTANHPAHLRIMAKIALLLRGSDVVQKIVNAETRRTIIDLLMEVDNEIIMWI